MKRHERVCSDYDRAGKLDGRTSFGGGFCYTGSILGGIQVSTVAGLLLGLLLGWVAGVLLVAFIEVWG